MATAENSVRASVEHLLKIDARAKPKVYKQVFDSTQIASVNYWLELVLSAGIATLGLVLNSPAVVIGAMLISPLMGPILAAGLALAASDVYLGIRAFGSIVVGVLVSCLVSALLVWLLPFHSATNEILARTQPNLLDLGVALLSGVAGAVVVCRGGSGGGVTALPGVAIAVALMPPLCTLGFGIGSGWNTAIVNGAGLLFLTNLAAIAASAFGVFWGFRMDSPEARTEVRITRQDLVARSRLYALLGRAGLLKFVETAGEFRWRIMMLFFVLVILYVPLRHAMLQLRDETISRAAVADALRQLSLGEPLLSQQVDVFPDRIVVRLVSASQIDQEKIQAAERSVLRRTGKEVNFYVRQVASEEELALLREGLRAPPAAPALPPAPPPGIATLGKEAIGRMAGPLKQLWPAGAGELSGYELGFTPEETVLHIRYQAEKPLDQATEDVLSKAIAAQLKIDKLRLVLEREPPAAAPKKAP
jgi:uncharacterized hydrophobic protein (TIGR00271 family)